MSVQLRNWSITLLLPVALIGFLHLQFSPETQMLLFSGITLFVILIWALEVLPSVQAAILLPLLYVLMDIAPAAKVFSPWVTFLPWICVAGLIFGDILGRTGLAKRIALLCVKVMGGSFTALCAGLMLAGIILAFLIPAIFARVVIFYAVTAGFADALDVPKKSRMSSALLMAGFCAATSPSIINMTASEVNLLGINMINAKEAVLTYQDFLIHNMPISLVYCCISLALIHLIKGKERLPEAPVVASMVRQRLEEMGRFSSAELKTLILLILGVVAFVVMGPQMGPWMFVLAACVAFFPGVSLIEEKHLRGLNWGFTFFVTGCMAIGAAAAHLGLPQMFGQQMAPMLEGQSPVMSVVLSYVAGVGVNFLLTPLAATSTMTGPLLAVAADLNMNPAPFIYSFLYGLEQYVLPYEYLLWLYFFMEGRVTLRHVVPAFGLRMVTTLVLLAAVAYPYWRMMGLF